MKKVLWGGSVSWIVMVSAICGVALPRNQDRTAGEGIRDQLIGAWRLAWLETQGPDGKPHKAERVGTLLYTRDGHMSVQIMARDPAAPPASGPVQYEQGGYEAYYGRYDVDERTHSVTHHVEGALVRSLIGKDLTRVYEFSGNQLILKSSRQDEHWTIAWEHY